MLIKTLFFDMDGLLLDTEKIYFHCWLEAAKQLGLRLDKQDALRLRSCDSQLARKIVGEKNPADGAYDLLRAKRKEIMNDYIHEHPIELKDGVKAFFDSDAIKQYDCYIVTSSIPGDKLTVLKEAGVLGKMKRVITTKDVKRGKPYPDVYTFAVREAGCSADECLAFEDSPNGLLSANSAGVKVVMIPDLSQPDGDLMNLCVYVFNNIYDSIHIL